MANEDEELFLDFVRSTCNLAILPYRSKTPEFHPINRPPTPESEEFWDVWLLNLDVSHKVVAEFISKQNHYYIDHHASDVIEFSRSPPIDDRYPRGRIYSESYSHFNEGSGQWVKKDQELVKWFEKMVRWIRKNFRKEDWLIYTGPGAQRLLDSGNYAISPDWLSIRRVQKQRP